MEDDCRSVWRLFGVLWAVQYAPCSLAAQGCRGFGWGLSFFPRREEAAGESSTRRVEEKGELCKNLPFFAPELKIWIFLFYFIFLCENTRCSARRHAAWESVAPAGRGWATMLPVAPHLAHPQAPAPSFQVLSQASPGWPVRCCRSILPTRAAHRPGTLG